MYGLRNTTAGPGHHRPYRRFGLGVVLAAVVVALSWAAVVRADVTPAEERAFRAVNTASDGLWPLLWPPMQLGTIGAPAAVAVVGWLAWRRWRPPTAIVLAGCTGWAGAQAVKALVVRARPDALLTEVVSREGARGLGFVSGHAAIAAAIAAVLWPYLRSRGRVASVGVVALVGIGRVYAGAHLPLDVVGGVAIGALAGLAANAVVGVPRRDDTSRLRRAKDGEGLSAGSQ